MPRSALFKPRGVPFTELEEVILTLDELEAVRLVDMLGLYQEEASQQMDVSRQTLGRILEKSRKKIADVLVNGKALRIEGGCIEQSASDARRKCSRCRQRFSVEMGTAKDCPFCRKNMTDANSKSQNKE